MHTPCFSVPRGRSLRLAVGLMALTAAVCARAAQVTIPGPSGSGQFGARVTVLANGNIVVTDALFDSPGGIVDVGAVYLYRPTGVLISTLQGSSANDRVGSGGVTALGNGNYVVRSTEWDNGAILNAGAVTFGSGTRGISGVVSPSNSLIGTTTNDFVGNGLVTPLSNGNYVVRSSDWDNGATIDAGAATFGSGTSGISGVVSPSNSLVGTTANDRVASGGVTVLSNANYVVITSAWDNAEIENAGAVTFGSGTSGISGMVSPSNSLVGTTANDRVGSSLITPLGNGNYVVLSSEWNNGATVAAGAATFGSGTSGISGAVSPSNSLVGTSANDFVGNGGVTPLGTGNYVVRSSEWDNGPAIDAGAVTFGSGTSGISGGISPSNSLVGSTVSDIVGNDCVTALSSGNYLVCSSSWDNAAIANAGAATFGSGTNGISGEISSSNSLIGTIANDFVGGSGATALSNGNYVVGSLQWDNGASVNAGAATFGSGTSGIRGAVSPSNSLVGTRTGDSVGSGVTALSNGNYVVRSSSWDNGAIVNAGAATFGSGASGISGAVSPTNSLVGSSANDSVGGSGVTALSNGNYVVRSTNWDVGTIVNAGAVTFVSDTSGISGAVSASNSLFGTAANDNVGSVVTTLSNGNYVVSSINWNNGATTDAGAVTFGSGTIGISDAISSTNSLVGVRTGDNVGSGVTALSNGNYVVTSPNWDNGATVNVGAATFGPGTSGISGVVSPSNSLVGTTAGDNVGIVTALSNGNYVVSSTDWDNGTIANAGAATLALANGSVIGTINGIHSVLGSVVNGGIQQTFGYDAERNQLAVGQLASNRVVLHRTGIATSISIVGDTPDPSSDGQPVTFTATVSGSSGPGDGQVRFIGDNGQSCVDNTPTLTSAGTSDFSCTIVFVVNGTSNVIAEYTGSILHAYSGSDPEAHTTVINNLFRDGFESP